MLDSGSSGSGSSGSSSGSGTGGSGTGSSSSDGGAGTCAAPPSSPPAGFAPPLNIFGTGCSAAQTTALGQCAVATTDAGQNACDDTLSQGAPDGHVNSCGECFITPIPPVGNSSTDWGYDLYVFFEPKLGDSADAFPEPYGPNLGGCVMGADKSAAGQACGKDIMAVTACELATCLPLCPVANTAPLNQAQVSAFLACTHTVDEGACQSYVTSANTDCAGESNASGTGPLDQCSALISQDEGRSADAANTAASNSALIGLLCGGNDAGF